MKRIRDISSYKNDSEKIESFRREILLKDDGFHVESFPLLVRRVAEISYKNREYALYFRGQKEDHRVPTGGGEGKGGSTFMPTLFRYTATGPPSWGEVVERFEKLKTAERLLLENYPLGDIRELRKYQLVRWALLQHYEVCATPFIDLTHSLRVACSFALHEAKALKEVFIFVFGMPDAGGLVSTSSADGIQLVRLLGICPPEALRPHHQEGYLAGEFPTLTVETKKQYPLAEIDLSSRVLAKFRIPSGTAFWPRGYSAYPWNALFPNKDDSLYETMQEIRKELMKNEH